MPFEKPSNAGEKPVKKIVQEVEKDTLKHAPKFEDYKKDPDDAGKTEVKIDAPPPVQKQAAEAAKEAPEKATNVKSKEPIESARGLNLASK
ncbi:hypothetical protein HZB94_02445 [Candidatus Falkowbacteria bacterium]|nr:hypothetical protein [Candidatus Falkowbacteria bacterium]